MSYNDKNRIEIDDMNIKSHLNTSLELSNITVSEDLINRTMEAIRQSQTTAQDDIRAYEQGRKKLHWIKYVRTFATVAAAAVLIFIGYRAVDTMNFNVGSKKNASDMAKNDGRSEAPVEKSEEQSVNLAATESADADMDNAAMMDKTEDINQKDITVADSVDEGLGADTEYKSEQIFTITADTTTADSGEGTSGNVGGGELTPADEKEAELNSELRLTFREIFLPDPLKAEYIAITNEANDITVTLTDQVDIQDFYLVMDQHIFAYSEATSSQTSFTLESKLRDIEASYTMAVGENDIAIITSLGDTESSSIYRAEDQILFIKNVDELYRKYSQ